ncbi:BrnT family toxin [Leptolyngbya sp. KIOST-1]|uniref:BrnT family toxin n=1 Tax=Leptolyngbya sp. KIOST-1 TaxID=1229172 RepID=UPI00399D5E11
MQFEYDVNKSRSNLAKHGIDFETAKLLWRDQYRVELEATSNVEPRSLVIGAIEGKI